MNPCEQCAIGHRDHSTWKVVKRDVQTWVLQRYSYRLGKMQTYPARFDMRMFATEKAKELNRAEREKTK